MISRHLIITGRVQGVGYRDALCNEAEARAVTGWVRNRRDGSVEALLQGAPDAVGATIAWARRGPGAARVADVREGPPSAEFDRPYARFEVLPTA
jgi:acylphosphatase